VGGQRENLEATRQRHGAPALHLGDQGMAHVSRAEHLLRRLRAVPLVGLLHGHDPKQLIARVAQRHLPIEPHISVALDEQHHRDRKELPAVEAHFREHSLVVRSIHETVERRESTDGHQLEVVECALRKLKRGKVGGSRAQIGLGLFRDDQVDKGSADGLDQSRSRWHHIALLLSDPERLDGCLVIASGLLHDLDRARGTRSQLPQLARWINATNAYRRRMDRAARGYRRRCFSRIRSISRIVSGFPCVEWPDRTIFSEATPSMWAPAQVITASLWRSRGPSPLTAMMERAVTPGVTATS